jgi:hypothetical protein
MREYNARLWLRTTKRLLQYRHLVASDNEAKEAKDLNEVLDLFNSVSSQCREVGLEVSANSATESAWAFKQTGKPYNHLVKSELDALHHLIEQELGSQVYLRIQMEYVRYFRDREPFGPMVSQGFPKAIRDVEEAGRALAFGLGTAAVFHLMRVMEAGLKTLANGLGIPYAPSWESYLTQIEKRITAKHKTKGIRWKRDEPYFRDIMGDLQVIKIAWRNPTMHIVRSYSQEEAEDVFRAVRAFMIRLSERFSDSK